MGRPQYAGGLANSLINILGLFTGRLSHGVAERVSSRCGRADSPRGRSSPRVSGLDSCRGRALLKREKCAAGRPDRPRNVLMFKNVNHFCGEIEGVARRAQTSAFCHLFQPAQTRGRPADMRSRSRRRGALGRLRCGAPSRRHACGQMDRLADRLAARSHRVRRRAGREARARDVSAR